MAIREIVENFSWHFEALENIGADIVNIDENENVEIVLSEENDYILRSFTLWLQRLKDIAAYNVGQYLFYEGDVDVVPQILQI